MNGAAAGMNRALELKVLRALDNRHLKLTLMPTEQCNFRCTYCYEDFELGTMPRSVVEGVKALMSARAPELRVLDLRWFGGEPMLAFHVVAEVNRHAQALAREFPQLQLMSSMTTNGYLLRPDRFAELLGFGVRHYQISLDGVGEKHDHTRRRKDGGPTFERIWSNLLAMRDTAAEFSVMLRVHFTPSTLVFVKELVEEINREFGSDRRFGIFFKAISRLGGPNDEQIERSPAGWQERAKAALSKLVQREGGTVDPVGSTYICYAAEPNSFVIRSDGQVARCTVAFNDPRNQVGRLHPDGTMTLDMERSRIWFEGLESLDAETLHCPFSKMPKVEPLVQITAPSSAAA